MRLKSWTDLEGGPLILRHLNFDAQGYHVAYKHGQFAVNIKESRITGQGLGEYVEDVDTRGDIHAGFFWSPSTRGIGSHAPSWAAVSTRNPVASTSRAVITGVPTAQSNTGVATPKTQYAPVHHGFNDRDDRYESIDLAAVCDFPTGTTGVVMATSHEPQQEGVFLHADPRMVAVHLAGEPKHGSCVYDTDKDFKYDSDRWAHLQSLTRVIIADLNAAVVTQPAPVNTPSENKQVETRSGNTVATALDTGDSWTDPRFPGTEFKNIGAGVSQEGRDTFKEITGGRGSGALSADTDPTLRGLPATSIFVQSGHVGTLGSPPVAPAGHKTVRVARNPSVTMGARGGANQPIYPHP